MGPLKMSHFRLVSQALLERPRAGGGLECAEHRSCTSIAYPNHQKSMDRASPHLVCRAGPFGALTSQNANM